VTAFYNEWERYPAAWIRNLIAAGHVADGIVDERSIVELRAADLAATQCHLFAGVAGWSYALRLAGWPDDRPVWTASCPCQPFSTAGKGRGTDDERHLWPVVFELVRERRPPILFGEQVASPAGRAWLDAVSADLESAGYAVGAANLCAAGVGAPHIRQRLYFVAVADADHAIVRKRLHVQPRESRQQEPDADRGGSACWMADDSSGGQREGGLSRGTAPEWAGSADGGWLGHADREPSGRDGRAVPGAEGSTRRMRPVDHRPRVAGVDAVPAWADAEWIACTDGKSRPAQPGSFPLVAGVSTRLGRDGTMETRNRKGELAGYGNAINAPLAATFIRAVMS
jgi:DNA (cytosine-5)-methyltransferase 1